MRIAYIVHQFPCLSEPFVMDQITGMLDEQQEVSIYANVGETEDPIHPQIAAYKLLEHTRYLPPRSQSKSTIVRRALLAALAQPRLIARPLRHSGKGIKDAVFDLARIHGFVWPPAPRFDIVHCQFGCVARAHWFSKSVWGAKLIVSFRGHDYSCMPRVFGPGMYQELFNAADAIMAVCGYAAARLRALGCPPEKIVTHFSGTDLHEFAFHERTPAPDGTLRILSVCRLEESKGLEFALRAVAALAKQHNVKLRYGIVGNGSLRLPLERLAASLGISDRVTFHGAQPRPRVRELMQQHDVFVLPSVTTSDGGQEGIPGTLREAMATGMPVVSTLHAGVPELVEDGVSGFLVPERDPSLLAARLLTLATEPQRWPAMGRAGRDHVERHFDIRRLNQRLAQFYRHVLSGRVPADFEAAERRSTPVVSTLPHSTPSELNGSKAPAVSAFA